MLPSAFPRPRPGLVLTPTSAEGVSTTDTLSKLAALSRRMGVKDTSVLVDDEISKDHVPDAVPCHDVSSLDLRYFDAGPDKRDVPFGFFCGSCIKFLSWNDPRRRDAVFMGDLKQREHCPRLTLTEQPIPVTLPLEEFIPQADQSGCDAFLLDHDQAPAAVAEIIEQLDSLSFEETSVVGFEVHRSFLAKKHGERFGYQLGDVISVRKAGRPIQVRVVGFQRKSGEEIIVTNVHDLTQVFTIPALRVR